MKFKIIHVDSSSENESDYETAVDMSHSSVYDVTYRLKNLSGLELTLSYTNIETSYSYYEEDIPYDFKAGDQVQYSHKSDPSQHKSSTYGHMEAILNEKLVILNKEEFIEYFNSYVDKSESEKYNLSQKGDSTELNKKFYQFQEQQSGYKTYENVITIGDVNDVSAFMDKISDKKENVWFDIELPESLKSVIEALDKQNEEINSHNSSTMINSLCAQANARLSIVLDKLTHQAKVELGLESKAVKPKMF